MSRFVSRSESCREDLIFTRSKRSRLRERETCSRCSCWRSTAAFEISIYSHDNGNCSGSSLPLGRYRGGRGAKKTFKSFSFALFFYEFHFRAIYPCRSQEGKKGHIFFLSGLTFLLGHLDQMNFPLRLYFLCFVVQQSELQKGTVVRYIL